MTDSTILKLLKGLTVRNRSERRLVATGQFGNYYSADINNLAKRNVLQQQIWCIWHIGLKMLLLEINFDNLSLKLMLSKIPNAPY